VLNIEKAYIAASPKAGLDIKAKAFVPVTPDTPISREEEDLLLAGGEMEEENPLPKQLSPLPPTPPRKSNPLKESYKIPFIKQKEVIDQTLPSGAPRASDDRPGMSDNVGQVDRRLLYLPAIEPPLDSPNWQQKLYKINKEVNCWASRQYFPEGESGFNWLVGFDPSKMSRIEYTDDSKAFVVTGKIVAISLGTEVYEVDEEVGFDARYTSLMSESQACNQVCIISLNNQAPYYDAWVKASLCNFKVVEDK